MINTVTGRITPDQLGKVLLHEHISFSYPGYQGDSRFWGKQYYEDGIRKAVDTLKKVKAQGIQTIVDATTNDCGRDPELLRRVSEEAEVYIICCTGYYFEGAGAPTYFKNMSGMGRDAEAEMTDLYETEITKGIGETGIKPGVLKISSSFNEITDYESMVARTISKLAVQYNLPVITHTLGGTMGIEQADMLLQAGVDPKHIIIGHSCDSTDMGYLLALAERGVGIGYDRWGHYDRWGPPNGPTDKVRLATFIALMKMGYVKQLTCAHDLTIFWRGVPLGEPDPLLKNWELTHFVDRIVPALLEHGATMDDLNAILIDNPRDFLSMQ